VSIALIQAIKWTLRKDGKFIPQLQLEKVTFMGRTVRRISGKSMEWIDHWKLGVGAMIYLTINQWGHTEITHVNIPMQPDLPQYCFCDIMFSRIGKHLVCENNSCDNIGESLVLNVPMNHVKMMLEEPIKLRTHSWKPGSISS
jgi:NAD-dependent DNA ligase